MRASITESVEEESMETGIVLKLLCRPQEWYNYITGIACQTEKAELCNAECQTDEESTELTVRLRRELVELKKENLCLKEELEKKGCTDMFSEEFLMKEKNQHILKFYTGTYIILLN